MKWMDVAVLLFSVGVGSTGLLTVAFWVVAYFKRVEAELYYARRLLEEINLRMQGLRGPADDADEYPYNIGRKQGGDR